MTKLDLSSGVTTVLARMRSHPEEFFGNNSKWKFLFSENLQQVLTEVEKGAIFEGLKTVRRQEFDELVMATLLKDKDDRTTTEDFERAYGFGAASVKKEGTKIQSGQPAQALRGAKKWLP
jgi:hypothetical protein